VVIGAWIQQLLGAQATKGKRRVLAVDRKSLRGSRSTESSSKDCKPQ
jgi:hypothetical protein